MQWNRDACGNDSFVVMGLSYKLRILDIIISLIIIIVIFLLV